MVRREIWVHWLAYNLIRKTMAQAALAHEKLPRQLSFAAALAAGKRKRDRSDIGNRGKQTWAVTSRWPPRPAAQCAADPASGTPIPGRDAWQSVSAIPSRPTAARAGRCGVAPPIRSRCRRD